MSEIKMNSKVWITSSRKIDGRYNHGQVVGIDKTYEGLYIISKSQFLRDIRLSRLKVAYIDVFTNKGCIEWFYVSQLSKEKPSDATA
jgi:hypothetical protein